jgi:hypothetical protein
MHPIPRFRHRSLLSWKRRIGTLFRRHALGRFLPGKRVRIVEIGGARFKRVTFPDAWTASRVARSLAPFRAQRVFPVLFAQSGSELLLEYVEGRPLANPLAPADCDRLAGFFAVLYAQERRSVACRGSGRVDEVVADLAFLSQAGVLDASAERELAAAAAALAPERLEVGYDYLDAIPRNFLDASDGRLVAVDVEELFPDQPLGGGVAKAALRIPGADRDRLLAGIRSGAALDLAPAMPFVELAFLAGWTKRALLKGRSKLVSPERFEPFRKHGRG